MEPQMTAKKNWKQKLLSRWMEEDYPGGEPVFQPKKLGKDALTWVALPLTCLMLGFLFERGCSGPRKRQSEQRKADSFRIDPSKSQIINFQGSSPHSQYAGIPRRSPGTLVKLRLLNVVETFSTAPVHAQVIDLGLGKALLGGTLIGDANPDPNFERINMTFRFVRDPGREDQATPIVARALSLDGTLGIEAEKKEGFFTRSVFSSANGAAQGVNTAGGSVDLKDVLLRALSSGFLQEFGAGAQVEKNRSQVLTLQPDTEFFAELTDYFPGGAAK